MTPLNHFLPSINYYGIVSLLNGIVAFFMGCYVFMTNRRQQLYRTFGIFAATIALWSIFYAIWQAQDSKGAALFYIKLTMVACYFIAFAFLWFVQSLIDEHPSDRIPAYFLIPLFFSIANVTPLMIEDVVPRLYFQYWPKPGPLMHVCCFIFNSTLIYAFYLLFQAWFRSSGNRRWQFKWITLTLLCVWAGGSTNWFLWYNIPIPPLPNLFVAISLLFLTYGIVRRRLFDVDVLADVLREAKLSAIGMMAASLNHELRNPLFIAKGSIESHLDAVEQGVFSSAGDEAEKGRNVFKTALVQLERAMDIVQRFSNFAKPQANHASKDNVVVREVLEDVLQLVSKECELKKIRVSQEPMNGLSILANRRQLEEVFFNLFVNACHAIEYASSHKPQATSLNSAACSREPEACSPQQGTIKISAAQHNGTVHIHIEDNGPGIEKENLRKIFEPFYTTKSGKGTGLGLYITKQLVEQNGGKISVCSSPGEGTTFSLEFKS